MTYALITIDEVRAAAAAFKGRIGLVTVLRRSLESLKLVQSPSEK